MRIKYANLLFMCAKIRHSMKKKCNFAPKYIYIMAKDYRDMTLAIACVHRSRHLCQARITENAALFMTVSHLNIQQQD